MKDQCEDADVIQVSSKPVAEAFEIRKDDVLLARYIPSDVAWGSGLNFFSVDEEFLQVGTWNYQHGKELKPHIHNYVSRKVEWTQEVLFIKAGAISAMIYDPDGNEVRELLLGPGDLLILLSGGHGYKILEDETQVLEIKNGPYFGADLDRRRI